MHHPPFVLLDKKSSGSAEADTVKISEQLEKEGEAELRVMAGRVVARKDMQEIISGFFPGTTIECIVDARTVHKKSGLHVWMVRISESGRSMKNILEIIGSSQKPLPKEEAADGEMPSDM